MKYIYYSLYQFYTKIIKVQKHYPPVVNIAGVLALLQTMIIFSLVDILVFIKTQNEVPPYHVFFPFGIGLFLYYLNEKYFEKRETEIVEEINNKPSSVKFLSHISTIAIIIILVWGHLFDGFHNLVFN